MGRCGGMGALGSLWVFFTLIAPGVLEIFCDPPPEVKNARKLFYSLPIPLDTVVRYTCLFNYRLIGEKTMLCKSKDQVKAAWDKAPPVCEKWNKYSACSEPSILGGFKSKQSKSPPFKHGDSVTFTCKANFTMKGNKTVWCQANNMWGPSPLPVCESDFPRECPSLPTISNGHRTEQHVAKFVPGLSVTFSCDSGYLLDGQKTIKCLSSGDWDGVFPTCKEAKCEPPGQFPNGQIKEPIGLQVGKTVHFSCNEGYRLIGSSTAMCIISDDGLVWDNEAPICDRIPCEVPQAITNGEFVAPTEDFYYGMVVTYRCKTGDRGEKLFNLVGESSLHCTSSDGEVGVWSGLPPQCVELGKCTPPHVENAVMVSESRSLFSLRDTVEFKCQPGFIMEGISSVQCQDLNKWEPELPSCFQVKSCGPFLEQLPNGNVLFPLNLQIGAKVSFVCNKGFQLKGNSASYCILAGKDSIWNSSVPVCERVTCFIPEHMSGIREELKIKRYYYEDNVTLECKDGHTLDGSSQSQCQFDATWNPPLANCVPRSRHVLILGICIGIVIFISLILVLYCLIRKYKNGNTTDGKCKGVSIHLNSEGDSCINPQALLASQEKNSSTSPARI